MNKLDQTLHSIWDLESLGIINADKSVLEDFDSSIHFKEGRYEVSLPWKEYHVPLPTNYELSLNRLKGLYWSKSCNSRRIQCNHTRSYPKGHSTSYGHSDSEDDHKLHYLQHHTVVHLSDGKELYYYEEIARTLSLPKSVESTSSVWMEP